MSPEEAGDKTEHQGADPSRAPEDLRSEVVETSTKDIEVEQYRHRMATEDRLLEDLLGEWKTQTTEERNLRKVFGWVLLGIFGAEVLVANIVLIRMGQNRLVLHQWVASVFFAGVFAQVSTLLGVVVKYLFADRPDQLLGHYIRGVFKSDK